MEFLLSSFVVADWVSLPFGGNPQNLTTASDLPPVSKERTFVELIQALNLAGMCSQFASETSQYNIPCRHLSDWKTENFYSNRKYEFELHLYPDMIAKKEKKKKKKNKAEEEQH